MSVCLSVCLLYTTACKLVISLFAASLIDISELDGSSASFRSLSSSLNLSADRPSSKLAWSSETNVTCDSKATVSETTVETPGSSGSEWDTDVEDEFKGMQ